MDLIWIYDDCDVDWAELSELYRIAPLGEKPPADLTTVFSNSMFKCFVYESETLVGVGRALADGLDRPTATHAALLGLAAPRMAPRKREGSPYHRTKCAPLTKSESV